MITAYIPSRKRPGLHWFYNKLLGVFLLKKDGEVVAVLKPKKYTNTDPITII